MSRTPGRWKADPATFTTWTRDYPLVPGERHRVLTPEGIPLDVLVRPDGLLTIEMSGKIRPDLFLGMRVARRVLRGTVL